eukprot:scaffold38108_cov17-Tisochrysis_lutea.AAC.2
MGQIARRPTGEVPWIPASLQPIAGLLVDCKGYILRIVGLAGSACVIWFRACASNRSAAETMVTCHRFFEGFMVALAVGASVLLCFDVLSLDPNSTRGIIVRSLDTAFTFFFGVEVRALWYLSHYAMLSEVLSSQGAVTVPMQ